MYFGHSSGFRVLFVILEVLGYFCHFGGFESVLEILEVSRYFFFVIF